ncbi:MAG: hypothetical protein ACYS22_09105 [Planctomycetota bacterium]|jgi:hypothetical protein
MKRLLIAAGALVAFALCAPPTQAATWDVLGKKTVNFGLERDTIQVGASEGLYDAIKFKVTGNAIHIVDVTVHYGNGTKHDVEVRQNIPKGGETRVIDLPGDRRIIKSVKFVYRTKLKKPGRGRAEIFLAGRRVSKKPAANPTPHPGPVLKWEHLGSKVVGFGVDHDIIAVTASEGRFTKIRLHIAEEPIFLGDLKVHFGNGETQDVKVSLVHKAGSHTRVIDLNGGRRVIKSISLTYRTVGKPRPGGRAKVSVFGSH